MQTVLALFKYFIWSKMAKVDCIYLQVFSPMPDFVLLYRRKSILL